MLRSSSASGRPVHHHHRRRVAVPPALFADPAPSSRRDRHRSGGLALVVLTVGAAMALLASPVAAQVPGTAAPAAAAAAPVVASLFYNSGPDAGGTAIFVNGSGFSGATAVSFGDQPALAFTVHSDTMITATVPPAATPATPELVVQVTVTTTGGASAPSDGSAYHYWARPAITAVSPSPLISSFEGGQTVHLTVANVGAAPRSVTVAGQTAGWWMATDTEVAFTTPPHAAGDVDVTVDSWGGTSAPVTLTYVDTPLPTLTALTPDHGPATGGTTVVITGTGFTGSRAVTFSGIAAPSFTVDSDTQITVVTPQVSGFGYYNVAVTSPVGESDWRAAPSYHFDGPPLVSSIRPGHGPTTGGFTVEIWGTELDRTTNVFFGDVPATSWTWNGWEILAVTPPHAAGVVNVTVDSDDGRSVDPAPYEYTESGGAPVVGAVSPTHGPVAGGTTLTVTGSGFTGATSVMVGSVEATSFTVESDTRLTLVTPAAAYPDTLFVLVTTPAGASDIAAGAQFVYDEPPYIWSLTPNSGPPEGGTVVELQGSGLQQVTTVTVGGVSTPFTFDPEQNVLRLTTPAHAVGRAVVVAEGPNGRSPDTPAWENTFIYSPAGAPIVDSFWPDQSSELGGQVVNISGTNLDTVTAVLFGTTPATSFTFDGWSINAVAPPHAVGTVDLTLRNPVGDSQPSAVPFTYVAQPPPTLYAVDPGEGPAEGGSPVLIWGSGFLGTTSVTFGGVAAPAFEVVDDTSIRVTTPPAADSSADSVVSVVVTTPVGTATSDADLNHYTYRAALPVTVRYLSPNRGPVTGGGQVYVEGSGFTGATSVRFGTKEATFSVVNDREIVTTPPAVDDPYLYDVTITTPRGTNPSSPTSWYLYRSEPVVWGIEANSGSVLGGNTVTITGDQFLDAWSVMFGWNAASFRVVDQHTIIATVPACAAGTVVVSVNTPAGTSALSLGSLYTYRTPGAPVVTKTEANRGSTAGGETVVLTGSGFTGTTGVRFEGIPATSFTVDSDTHLTAVAPAHAAAGLVNIDVETPAGTNPNAPASWYLYQ